MVGITNKMLEIVICDGLASGAPFSKVPVASDPEKLVFVCRFYIQDLGINSFDIHTKMSGNETELTGFWAKTRSTIPEIYILKFGYGSVKLPGLSRNRPLGDLINDCGYSIL